MTALPQDVIDEFLERRRAEDAERGLPEHIEDPDVLDRIAAIVADGRTTAPAHD